MPICHTQLAQAGGDTEQLPASANADVGMSKHLGASQGCCGNVAMCDQVRSFRLTHLIGS